MADITSYTDATFYRAMFRLQDDGVDRTAQIEAHIASASRVIDRYCRRQFGRKDTATARRYTVNGERRRFYLDDVSAPDDLLVEYRYHSDDWVTLRDGDYEMGPYDAPTARLEPRPYEWIDLLPNARTFACWPPQIRITAKWGWPAVPDPIRDCAAELVGLILRESPRSKGEVSQAGIPVESTPQGRRVMSDFLSQYRKVRF